MKHVSYESRINEMGWKLINKERVGKETVLKFAIDDIVFTRGGTNFIKFCKAFNNAIEQLESSGCKVVKTVGVSSKNFPIVNIIDNNGYCGDIDASKYRQYINTNKKISDVCEKNNHKLLSFCSGIESDIIIDFNCGHHPQSVRYSYYLKSSKCRVCINKRVESGYNDIATTHPHLIKYFNDKEDAYKYTAGSGQKVLFKCPNCESIRYKVISSVVGNGYNCNICNDNLSIGEKLVYSFLSVHNVDFEIHKTFDWSKRKEYDFYIPNSQTIIEVHGLQHYKETGRGRTLKEEQKNDLLKINLANENGIKNYIIIDARISDIDFIKNNIIKSKLVELLKIKDVCWDDVDKKCIYSLMKEAWDIKNKNTNISTSEISRNLKISKATVIKWLKIGKQLNMCHYDAKEESHNCIKRNSDKAKRVVLAYKDGRFVGEYESASYIEKNSEKMFGELLYSSEIRRVCNGIKKSYKNFTFKYREDYKYEQSTNKKTSKLIALYQNGNLIKIYNSCRELSRMSLNDVGVKLQAGKMCEVCNGKRIQHKGYTAKYID